MGASAPGLWTGGTWDAKNSYCSGTAMHRNVPPLARWPWGPRPVPGVMCGGHTHRMQVGERSRFARRCLLGTEGVPEERHPQAAQGEAETPWSWGRPVRAQKTKQVRPNPGKIPHALGAPQVPGTLRPRPVSHISYPSRPWTSSSSVPHVPGEGQKA